MKKIIYTAIHRRGLMFVLFLFLAVVGYYSWTRLAIDAYPDIADTTVQVVTPDAGTGGGRDRTAKSVSLLKGR